ncbi:pilus assembly PilX family protein [Aliikangiella maris]|uniref:PilX N-terminal domain-containing pilus assembly protein n=2 Tax=Aliikangiella maris TaxID=3162458 RepID=A0ABV2BNN3_9GAMM
MNQYQTLNQLKNQQGAALFVALIMLVALTIIGLTATQRSNLQERMASNMHVQNLTFNASESAIGSFLTEANTGDSIDDPNHLIFNLRINGVLGPFCIDKEGLRKACDGKNKLDKDGRVESRYSARVVGQCSVAQCGGFSFGADFGCRVFRVDSAGTTGGAFGDADTQSSESSFWAYEVSPCL